MMGISTLRLICKILTMGLVSTRARATMTMAATARVRPTVYMKAGAFTVSMGPGCTPCRFRAARNMAAWVEPGMARVSMGIMAPGMQALLAVSEQARPA